MPLAARQGDAIETGHGCDAVSKIGPAAAANTAPMLNQNVTIEGKLGAVVGDIIDPTHTISTGTCVPHTNAVINAGSLTVTLSGIAAARFGDSADTGTITGSATKVTIG